MSADPEQEGPGAAFERLLGIMDRLRSPGGCPWDAEQTHESLVKHGIEEAYEVADAVKSGDFESIVDELDDPSAEAFLPFLQEADRHKQRCRP